MPVLIEPNNRIFLAIPHTGWIRTALAAQIIVWIDQHKLYFCAPENLRPIAYARNICVKMFLESNCNYLWFVDSDVTPPHDAPKRLLDADKLVVCGLYHQNRLIDDGRTGILSMSSRRGESGDLEWYQGKGLETVDAAGTGCMMIHRSVFEKIEPPWFEETFWGEPCKSDDYIFCEKLEKAGIPVWMDFDLRCKHLKPIDL